MILLYSMSPPPLYTVSWIMKVSNEDFWSDDDDNNDGNKYNNQQLKLTLFVNNIIVKNCKNLIELYQDVTVLLGIP